MHSPMFQSRDLSMLVVPIGVLVLSGGSDRSGMPNAASTRFV